MFERALRSGTDRTGWEDFFAHGRFARFVLIELGVWIGAADSLVTATIMPSVAADLGGYAYFSWAIAGFLVGTILASASAGRFSEQFGLSVATTAAGLLFALGAALSAAAPNIAVFLIGRLVQGLGSGWISGLAMVAVALLFPERHVARVFASTAAVWGVATVLGPLIGGLFAAGGQWRSVFWLFAGQAVLFAAVAPRLLKGSAHKRSTAAVPWRQLGALALGIAAIGLGDVSPLPSLALVLVAAGFVLLAWVLRIDAGAAVRLLPHRAGDLRTICGAGYASMFAFTAGSMGLTVYGPPILQQLYGLSPLWAGYVVAAEALAWTLAAFAVAGVSQLGERRWIRVGAACILAGAALLAYVMHRAPLAWIVAAAAIMGAGFGFSSSLMSRRVLSALTDEDLATGSSALIAVRETGGAVGAAIAGAAANLAGFAQGLTLSSARGAAVWVFVTALPLAAAGTWAAWRLSGSARKAAPRPATGQQRKDNWLPGPDSNQRPTD